MHGILINGFNSLFILVYPSLESEEDNPVFKSRSKKRKSSDDTPYSPTGQHVQYIYKVAAFKSLVKSMCSNPVCCHHHSPCRTLGSSARATGERRRPSGLHRNRTGCSCSKAFTSGIIMAKKLYIMQLFLLLLLTQKYVSIGGAAKDQEEEEKHQKEGNSNRGATENLSGQ